MKIILKYPQDPHEKGRISPSISRYAKLRERIVVLELDDESKYEYLLKTVTNNNGEFLPLWEYDETVRSLLIEMFEIFRDKRIEHDFKNPNHLKILERIYEIVVRREKKNDKTK